MQTKVVNVGLLFGIVVGSVVAGPVSPAAAHVPPADSCSAVVTGVRIPHDPGGLVGTAEVTEVTAVVTCDLTGLLTHAPIDYVPYSGDITVGVLNSGGDPCIAGGALFVSAGPTLVMTASGTCTFPVNEPRSNVHTPIVWWATYELDPLRVALPGYTIHSQTGVFIP